MESTVTNNSQVPLIKVVKSAIIDTYGNISERQELYSHWAARGLRLLNDEVLKVGRTKVLLKVNANTMTATLPPDYGKDVFVGYIKGNKKVSMKVSAAIADICNIAEIPYEDKCTSCGQDKTICEDLAVTEDVTLVVINGSTYENKVIKKLYPNGDYYLETHKWVTDIDTGSAVEAPVEKEFITSFGLQPCGCLQQTQDNIKKLKNYCYDSYCCNYATPCNEVSNYEYAIHEDTGLIQVDFNYPYEHIYLEYLGFMKKQNGHYMVPEVAFETLVEWTKWRAIKDKKGEERWRIKDAESAYLHAKKSMLRLKTRVSLSFILSAARSIPKFNLDYENSWYSCFDSNAASRLLTVASGGSVTASGGGSTTINTNTTTIINNASYQLAVKTGNGTGHPVDGQSTYQNNLLKNSTDVEFIIVAKQVLSKIDGDFTLDANSGVVDISPNAFSTGDSLIIPYNKIS